jgi:hypothetical protein
MDADGAPNRRQSAGSPRDLRHPVHQPVAGDPAEAGDQLLVAIASIAPIPPARRGGQLVAGNGAEEYPAGAAAALEDRQRRRDRAVLRQRPRPASCGSATMAASCGRGRVGFCSGADQAGWNRLGGGERWRLGLGQRRGRLAVTGAAAGVAHLARLVRHGEAAFVVRRGFSGRVSRGSRQPGRGDR